MSSQKIFHQIETYQTHEIADELSAQFIDLYNSDWHAQRPLHFHIPTFKHYESDELPACGRQLWPAISITGPECKLQCDHCKAGILKPMLPATSADSLLLLLQELIEKGARGCLLSGGSNHRNEVEYAPYLAVIEKIKSTHPEFQIAVHTALVDENMAERLDSSGIDVAMFDLIGAQDTISQVYHLKRRVEDFEKTLMALRKTSMKVVPHIVIGLHYGHLLGEWHALDMIARQGADALILVVVMPQYASPSRPFLIPDTTQVGQFFVDARRQLSNTPILLGCARPAGYHKSVIDHYAILAGLDGIAHPSEGIVALAREMGRRVDVSASCCSISDMHVINDYQVQNTNNSRLDEKIVLWT